MDAPVPASRPLWRDARVWLGLAVSALFLVLLLRQVGGHELRDAATGIEPWWLLPAGGTYLAALWLRGQRWRLVLRSHVAIGGGDAFALLVIGYAANNLLPVRAGEVLRAGLLQQRHGAAWTTGLGTIVVERVLDAAVLALFLAGTVAVAGGSGLLRLLAAAGLAVSLAAVALLVALGRSRQTHRGERLLRLLPSPVRVRVSVWLAGFTAGLSGVQGGGTWGGLAVLTALSWGLEAAAYALVGIAFGLTLDVPLYLGVCGAANLAIAAPSTAGGVGPFEFFAREVAVRYGAPVAAATAYALVLHALLLGPVVVLALVLLWRRHLGPRTLLAGARPGTLRRAP